MQLSNLAKLLLAACLIYTCSKAGTPQVNDNQNDSDGVINVMSYNIQHGRGMDDEINLERIADVIKEEGADIVALQEVDVGVERSNRLDIPRELSELTGMPYFTFGKNIEFEGGEYGNATLSKYPITMEDNVHYQQLGSEQRGILQTVIDYNGRDILILNTHLDYSEDDEERLLYVQGMRDSIITEHDTDAAIAAGDFNDFPGSATHEKMKEFMYDLWEEKGEGDGFTFPPDDPDRRIDYIFHDDGLRALEARVPQTMASDHLPVVGVFQFIED